MPPVNPRPSNICAKHHSCPVSSSQDHAPILSFLPKMWIPATGKNGGITFKQRNLGRTAFVANTDQWKEFMADSARHILHSLETHAPFWDFYDLHSATSECFRRHFPADCTRRSEVWEHRADGIRTKWQHRTACQAITPTACFCIRVVDVFKAWYHLSCFQALSKYHRKHSTLVRRSRFQELIAEAQLAANRYDTHKLFQIINGFAPKQPKRRIQLRNSQGQIATPVEELAIITQYVTEIWAGPALPDFYPHVTPGIPFGVLDVLRALQGIPISKAVAAPCSPGVIWKAHAELVAPGLFSWLQFWWNSPTPYIPPSWKHGWISFLAKPQKAPIHPSVLRPIALQCPLGKAILGMLSKIGQQETYPTISSWPL